MRYKRAVEKLRILAETCERVKMFWFDTEPFLKAVYAFGEVLGGADPLDAVQVAVAINLPPEEVPWESSPEGTDWLANELGSARAASCTSGGRTWIRYGITTSEARCASGLSMAAPTCRRSPRWKRGISARSTGWSRNRPMSGCQLRDDLDAALAHLREIRDKYWDHDWRREHRGYGRYPENELWDAVEGYLDLLDASRGQRSDA